MTSSSIQFADKSSPLEKSTKFPLSFNPSIIDVENI